MVNFKIWVAGDKIKVSLIDGEDPVSPGDEKFKRIQDAEVLLRRYVGFGCKSILYVESNYLQDEKFTKIMTEAVATKIGIPMEIEKKPDLVASSLSEEEMIGRLLARIDKHKIHEVSVDYFKDSRAIVISDLTGRQIGYFTGEPVKAQRIAKLIRSVCDRVRLDLSAPRRFALSD